MNRQAAERELLGALRSVYGGVRSHIAAVKRDTGISAAMLWALDEIVRDPGMRAGRLSERLAVHPTTASNLCTRLKRAGLVRSRPDPEDRRCVKLFPTAAGQRAHEKAPNPKRGVLPAAIEALQSADLELALVAFQALRTQVQVLGYHDDPLQPFGRR